MIERVQGCSKYSMNAQASEVGYPPAAGSRTIHALMSYMIKANMALCNFLTLTDQEAWDVAAFMNAQERPQDPRRGPPRHAAGTRVNAPLRG